MPDEYRSRMLAIVEELHAQGMGRYTAAPPAYRLAWRLGIRVPPPIYQSSFSFALQAGARFAVGFGLLMWVLFWRSEQHSLMRVLLTSTVAGAVFGLRMAAVHRSQRKRFRRPAL